MDVDSPNPGVELRRRMERELREVEQPDDAPAPRPRTLGELLKRSEILAEKRRKKEAARRARAKARKAKAAAEKRRKRLKTLIGQDERLWAEVRELIATRLPKSYDRAVGLLSDLQGLSEIGGTESDFNERLQALSSEHKQKRTFIDRLRGGEAPLSSESVVAEDITFRIVGCYRRAASFTASTGNW